MSTSDYAGAFVVDGVDGENSFAAVGATIRIAIDPAYGVRITYSGTGSSAQANAKVWSGAKSFYRQGSDEISGTVTGTDGREYTFTVGPTKPPKADRVKCTISIGRPDDGSWTGHR